eukprot:TRINITY_DN2525_c0_g10_i1.p1 TRINITY_DN2525_c0_g10~~TRINITY_DN2525_c0_g10_i1.p1  ORF type:complete len:143 (+),score=23.30 TRINITY_DN2525_c0_g10_i1:63-491(+)
MKSDSHPSQHISEHNLRRRFSSHPQSIETNSDETNEQRAMHRSAADETQEMYRKLGVTRRQMFVYVVLRCIAILVVFAMFEAIFQTFVMTPFTERNHSDAMWQSHYEKTASILCKDNACRERVWRSMQQTKGEYDHKGTKIG